MGWVMSSKAGKKLGCEHNLHRTVEYRFSKRPLFANPYIYSRKDMEAQAGDEIVFHCPFGCEEISILVTERATAD